MWTYGDLVRLSGLPESTMKWYCKPHLEDEAESRRSGAGLLHPADKKGRVNLYDEDSLLDLVLVLALRGGDYPVDVIRSYLNSNPEPLFEALDTQVERLKAERRRIDRQLRVAESFLEMANGCCDADGTDGESEGDQFWEAFEKWFAPLFCGIVLEEYAELLGVSIDPKYSAYAKESVHIGLLRAEGAPKSEIDERISRIDVGEETEVARKVLAATAPSEFSLSSPFDKVSEWLSDGLAPDDAVVQGHLEEVYDRALAGFGMKKGDFRRLLSPLFDGGIPTILLELSLGKGSTRFLSEALTHFCGNGHQGDHPLGKKGALHGIER